MKVLYFVLIAVVITMGARVYQRKTGPTHPKKITVEIDGTVYQFKLVRSHGGIFDCKLEFDVPDTEVTGTIFWRRYPTRDAWIESPMERTGEKLAAYLPHQPPAGKLEYRILFYKNGLEYPIKGEDHATVIRFKGDVPIAALLPHIILMFAAMLVSNLAGIMALYRHRHFRRMAIWTLALLGIGGMVMGPIVQWYAFGEAWAGVPFAWDLTDNKTLLAFLFWILAVAMNRKKEQPAYVIAASLVMLFIYLIPHSMYGSELDPETGKIIQGFIPLIR